LREGVTLDQAAVELNTIARRIEQANPKDNADAGLQALDLRESLVGDARTPLYVLLAAVALVLLIACANIANLLLTKATGREREMAVRAALGASRGRLASQLLTESLVLAAAGGIAGLALSAWALDVLKALMPANVPRLHEVSLDANVLLFTLIIATASGLIFGFAPAVQTSLFALNESLKEGVRGNARAGRHWLRRGLIVAEVALSLVLLVAAGLMLKSFARLQEVSPGVEPENVLTIRINAYAAKYRDDQRLLAFYDELSARVKALPGVQSAGFANSLPPDQLELTDSFTVENRPLPEGQYAPIGPVLFVSPGYFDAAGIPIVRGRNFAAEDRIGSPLVTVINETLAAQYFPNEDPIGKRIKVGGVERPKAPWMQIIGVAGDVRYSGLDKVSEPTYYEPISQVPWLGVYLVVKTAVEPLSLVPPIRQALLEIDRDVPIAGVRSMEQIVSESLGQPRFRTFLLAVFAALALLLATVGVYGVLSYAVGLRTREIGIRISLGAKRADVLRMVAGEMLLLVGCGIALGLASALALTRALRTLLFEVTPTDLQTFLFVTLFLLAVASVASYIPARRASKVDPTIALRYE
jgi:putative ABC transport system permease protein